MSSRKTLMLILALIIGAGTFFIFRSSMQTAPGTVQAPVQTTEVLAAARDMPMGTILKETDLKWIPWSDTAQNTKLYIKGQVDITALVGAVLRDGFRADEPIIIGRVVQPHEQGFLAAVLQPGMRAVSLTLTPSAEVAGFIFPGDYVDVILTHSFVVKVDKNDTDTTERRLSETIVHNARVLALDQKSDNQSTDPKVAQLATLEVSSKQAEKLALAADMSLQNGTGHGTLSLILRSLANEEGAPADVSADTGPTMDSDVSPVFSRVTHLQKVEVMRGKETTESIFQKQK